MEYKQDKQNQASLPMHATEKRKPYEVPAIEESAAIEAFCQGCVPDVIDGVCPPNPSGSS